MASAVLLLALVSPLAAQQPARDTVVALDPLVVTADRASTPLASSIASVSVLTAEQLASMPQLTLADALRQVPGFALVDLDGLGRDPQVMVRGFYGGGEAEYVVVMVDGRPVNDVQAGLVAWDAIPLEGIDRIEVVRGGSSSLHGDAAIGAVINVITRDPGAGAGGWSFAAGSHGTWRAGADLRGRMLGRDLALSGGIDRTDGFREHGERTAGRVRGAWTLANGDAGSIRVEAGAHWRDFEEPGPLDATQIDSDPAASGPFYRFDRGADRGYRLGLDAGRPLGARTTISGSVFGELRAVEAVRTVALAPTFADTKERVLGTRRVLATAQMAIEGTGLPVRDRLVAGVDASRASLDARYYDVLAGDPDAYLGAAGGRGELDTDGEGQRTAAAAFLEYTMLPAAAVRLSVGGRADRLHDSFDVRPPEDPESFETTHTAFSPRIGVNVQYLSGDARAGHVWATAGRSFKAPTLDQLFDRRRIPVPFPPFDVTTSNPLLEPQRGTSAEVGIYQRVNVVPGSLSAAVTLSAYRMDMKDELDFDLETLRYVNIGRSRHRGIEAGITLAGPGSATAFLTYTHQDVVSRTGENAGRHLKAIPRHFASGGVSLGSGRPLAASVIASRTSGIHLDDANTIDLPPFTRVDARLARPVGGLDLVLDVRNVFDARYSTTGFPDPGGSGTVYYRPGAGRTFELGVRGGF